MGNEESQQGGAQGPQQQGAPGTFGMGQPQQPARFGGPPGPMGPPPGMRQVAPTGRPNLRPGGPGPPQATRGPFPGGGPRQPQQAGPARPVQVGVQPWAEPPVQQPAQFRGPSPRPSMMQPPQQPVQKAVVQPPKVQPQPEMDIGVDLSNLSEEEKAKILSVMARAQDLDQDYERHKR